MSTRPRTAARVRVLVPAAGRLRHRRPRSSPPSARAATCRCSRDRAVGFGGGTLPLRVSVPRSCRRRSMLSTRRCGRVETRARTSAWVARAGIGEEGRRRAAPGPARGGCAELPVRRVRGVRAGRPGAGSPPVATGAGDLPRAGVEGSRRGRAEIPVNPRCVRGVRGGRGVPHGRRAGRCRAGLRHRQKRRAG